ncbi:MAG: ATP-binding protein [Methanomassiliicoccales archaeon]|nr:ATP-binding protein [Methanomassiliicoccales archaeon]
MATKPFDQGLQERMAALEQTYQATLNILEDIEGERAKAVDTQRALVNMLEDIEVERVKALDTQHALINMLEDIEDERMKVERARTALTVANKELEAFSYSVSHDLRAPLRAVSGFSQALVEDETDRLSDDGKRYLQMIQDNAHRMGRLIDDLLTFSRLSRQQMLEQEVDMDAMAASVFEEQRMLEPDRQMELSLPGTPKAHGDAAMLRQVMINLISNAIKFTRPREVAKIEFGYDPSIEGGAYYVRDNGVGFEMRYVNKLFGVFQRLHSIKDFEGTGIGLALVSRIISRHGGRAWGVGEVDRGAMFYFTIRTGGVV